jgi:phospholipid-binding lipoprotein MlaA
MPERPVCLSTRLPAAAAAGLALLLALAPAIASAAAPKDPLERLNRATYAFNDLLDRMIARPAARAYKAAVPEPARRGVSHFVANLAYPTVVVNDALQGKLRDAGSDAARFVVNSIAGIGGFGDPATRLGLAAHDEDFGQTLGHWGVPAGPYLVLPLLGPSDLRDAPARYVDRLTNVSHYPKQITHAAHWVPIEHGLDGVALIDKRTELLSTDEVLQRAFDKYAVMRNAYVAHREYLVRDGNVPDENYDDPLADPPAH